MKFLFSAVLVLLAWAQPQVAQALVWEPHFGLRLNRASMAGLSSPDTLGIQAGTFVPFYLNSQLAFRSGLFLVTRDVEVQERGQALRFSRTGLDFPVQIYGILHPQFGLYGGFNLGLKLASSMCQTCTLRNEKSMVLQPLIGGEYRSPQFSAGMGIELETEYYDQFKQSAIVFHITMPISVFTNSERAPASSRQR